MSYLVYCIFRQPGTPGPRALVGVGGQPVQVVANHCLGAAVSPIGPGDLAPEIREVLAYEQVVESFHREGTVIPMRYGCVFEKTSMVLRLLEERGWQYLTLLQNLEGCVEMGIRLLLPGEGGASGLGTPGEEGSPQAAATNPAGRLLPAGPGQAYLAAQRQRYACQDREAGDQILLPDRVCRTLAGVFVRHKRESLSLGDSLLVSLYFLVPRYRLELFRQIFRELSAAESGKFLLSGPWPPYNFVTLSHLDPL